MSPATTNGLMVEILSGEKSATLKAGRPGSEILKEIAEKKIIKIPADILGFKVGDEIWDLHKEIPENSAALKVITPRDPEALDIIRHSTAHILAQAVKEIYPEVQVTIGPVIEQGFFYDFSKKGGFKEEELPAIEERMKAIIAKKLPVKREEWEVPKALKFFESQGEHYKCEIIRDLVAQNSVQTVSVYWHGQEFVDLCRGPHVPHTGWISAFKLMSVAGAYWRGNEKNEMLGRIYGTAFESPPSLKAYLARLEEAKKRDHRRIGVDQDLFSFHPEAPASPFFHPNGAFLYLRLVEFLRSLNKAHGFEEVISPLLLSQELWKNSGHYDNYRENMYFTKVDERDFAVKPMNCPGHCLIYKAGHHSYRELPMRLAEFGRVHRHERSGVTQGLFRVRTFVQDDAHVYCTEDQVEGEIANVLEMIRKFYKVFGFEYRMELSTRPEKSIGSDETWQKAEQSLKNALEKGGHSYRVNPGDGAFYGPKIDFHLKDSLERSHQCGTIQLDFSMPGRFGLEFSGSDNKSHTPVMIHKAIAGSLERFLGILIEHFAGHFPLWLAPLQAVVLTVSDDAANFAREIHELMKLKGFRVRMDDSSEKLAAKIKQFQAQKPPYFIILGGREAQSRTLSLRLKGNEQKQGVSVETFLAEFASLAEPQF